MADNEFDEYVSQILDFDYTNKHGTQDYAERLGNPDELSSCIGLICIAFQKLEEELSKGIATMIGESADVGTILTSEMSFKNRVHAFASLVKHMSASHHFSLFTGHEREHVDQIVKAFFRAEELRNRVIHSLILEQVKTGSEGIRIVRIKRTAKAGAGLKTTKEDITIAHLLNIYDWTVSLSMEVEHLLWNLQKKD